MHSNNRHGVKGKYIIIYDLVLAQINTHNI